MGKHAIRWLLAAVPLLAVGCASPMMKATPFYTGEHRKAKGPPENRVNLWPVAYYRKPALSVLWPLMDFTDDHVALRPLFSVYKLDKERHEWSVLWPLVELDYDTGDHHVFPVFWDDEQFIVFPVVWWGEDVHGILPAFWWDEGVTVFPLFWYRERDCCHLLPLWWRWRDGEYTDTHVLWPLLRRVDWHGDKGFRLWPLVGHTARGDAYRHDYALWPLLHDWHDGGERVRVAAPIYVDYRGGDEHVRVVAPLYAEHRDGDDGWWMLLPFVFQSKQGDAALTLTPVWASGRKGKERWSAVAPLYYYSVDEEAGARWLLTPIVSYERTPTRTEWAMLPLLSSVAWGEGERDVWAFAPLVHARWGGGELEHHVLPLYYYSRGEGMFLSPLASWRSEGDEGFLNLGTALFHHSYDGDEHDVWAPWPLAHLGWDATSVTHHLFPLYYYRRGEDGSRTFRLLVFGRWSRGADGQTTLGLPLTRVEWGGADGRTRASLFPLFRWRRRHSDETTTDKTGEPTARVETREASLHVPSLLPLAWHVRTGRRETPLGRPDAAATTDRNCHWGLFPLCRYEWHSRERAGGLPAQEPERKGDFRLLLWLYDWRAREGTDFWDDEAYHAYRRSRVLWRVLHDERLDGDRSLDVFPFITWDRRADGGRQFSFLWRLFRTARTAEGERKLDVLFIPLVRRPARPASPVQ